MKESFIKVNLMVKVLLYGIMERNILESGLRIKKTVKESTFYKMVVYIKEILWMI